MENHLRVIFSQWDRQETARLARAAQDQAYIELNNSYLAIERGEIRLNVFHANNLRTLVMRAYDRDDPMIDWWHQEFLELPRWNDV